MEWNREDIELKEVITAKDSKGRNWFKGSFKCKECGHEWIADLYHARKCGCPNCNRIKGIQKRKESFKDKPKKVKKKKYVSPPSTIVPIKKYIELCNSRKIPYELKDDCVIIDGEEFREFNENNLDKIFLKYFNKTYNEYAYDIYRNVGEFPIYKYDNPSGLNLIRQYHPSIYKAHTRKKPSPYDAWYNEELMIKNIKNRLIYSKRLDDYALLNGFTINKIAPKVSIFDPKVAKYLVDKYIHSNEIFDPFSGYSGRLLGSIGKKYIGQDLNEITVNESNQIIKDFNLDAVITCKDVLESQGKYESLFTCPPYSNKEMWGKETIFKSCDEWIDECLNRFDCKEYLFVVDGTEKYKDYIVEELTNKSHFGKNKEYVIYVSRM